MLQERARECYHNLSEEEKNRKHQYVCNQYRNLFIESEPREEEKNRKGKQVREQYRNLFEEEKDKKDHYDWEQYRSLVKNI